MDARLGLIVISYHVGEDGVVGNLDFLLDFIFQRDTLCSLDESEHDNTTYIWLPPPVLDIHPMANLTSLALCTS